MVTVEKLPLPLSGSQKSFSRNGSFTDVEKFCLRALLLDTATRPPSLQESKSEVDYTTDSVNDFDRTNKLDDSVLFQLPFAGGDVMRSGNKFGRHEKKILGLWQAHEDGVHHVIMQRRQLFTATAEEMNGSPSNPLSGWYDFDNLEANSDQDDSTQSSVTSAQAETDVEVRPTQDHDDDSSWGEEDGGFLHFDAWEVLKDEYATDFGFDYKGKIRSVSAALAQENDCQNHVFRILGTSADDRAAQPHVLSPPLMDSLLSFVPDSVSMGNYWLKFSLIRDGCSLYTLKQYVKASPYTILAIETTKGDVFGAFTSHIWRNHPTFFGFAPAFLWRMRHNRRTPCHCLFEQARMESEIDCYQYSGLNDLIQVMDDDRLAIGGGMVDGANEKSEAQGRSVHDSDLEGLKQVHSWGFGICLDGDLLGGTTSPCGTFRNPCLINQMSRGEVFEVANLEVWTLTPCTDVKRAEQMEMRRYFLEESQRSVATNRRSTNDVYSNPYLSQEDFQTDFYRRIGQNQPTGQQGLQGKNTYRASSRF